MIIRAGKERYAPKVTANLYTALKYLRHTDKIRLVWIAAICINQQNPQDRRTQVSRMADIFQSASNVVVWLGPTADDSKAAMEVLALLASKIQVDWKTWTPELVGTKDPGCRDTDDLLDHDKELVLPDDTWKALLRLLDRTWFLDFGYGKE